MRLCHDTTTSDIVVNIILAVLTREEERFECDISVEGMREIMINNLFIHKHLSSALCDHHKTAGSFAFAAIEDSDFIRFLSFQLLVFQAQLLVVNEIVWNVLRVGVVVWCNVMFTLGMGEPLSDFQESIVDSVSEVFHFVLNVMSEEWILLWSSVDLNFNLAIERKVSFAVLSSILIFWVACVVIGTIFSWKKNKLWMQNVVLLIW